MYIYIYIYIYIIRGRPWTWSGVAGTTPVLVSPCKPWQYKVDYTGLWSLLQSGMPS